MAPVKRSQKASKEESIDEKSFQELGVDSRLVRALQKKGIHKPFPIQSAAIPLILEGKDVVARAVTGSGKTFAYLLPMLQKQFSSNVDRKKLAPNAFVLVPTRELCHQVYMEVLSLIELSREKLKVVQLSCNMQASELRAALTGSPDVLVSTPACIAKCLSSSILQPASINGSLETLVLDEADLLLSHGYENDIKSFTPHIPRSCQCLLMCATTSADVDKLKKLILHNPFILTLHEVGNPEDELIPKNVKQFRISCPASDKLLYILAVLKFELFKKKVLIFTNTIKMSIRLKLFLEKFGIKSAILHEELPQNSRLFILQEFNAGLFDYLIATDDGQPKEKDAKLKSDSEFGVVRGIDFRKVDRVINFEMPPTVAGYLHRIGRTGRAYSYGESISLVSPDEMATLEENQGSNLITEFSFRSKNEVENLRYRAEDVARSITKFVIRESRFRDMRNGLLNSEKLKAHFESNPRDLDLLKHDKVLSKDAPPSHLRYLPEYLIDKTTQEAREMLKLAARDAMANNNRHKGAKRKLRKCGDPLKAISVAVSKRPYKGVVKRGASHNKTKAI